MTKIFVDAAEVDQVLKLVKNPYISGITTNPTLMKRSGVTDFEIFSKAIISHTHLPLSLEVFSDDITEMYDQALKISSWGEQVYVKIPVTNSLGTSTTELIKDLVSKKIKVNVTALLGKDQIDKVISSLNPNIPSIISIFAGRIADTGRDPCEYISYAINKTSNMKSVEILWASTREIYNLYQARDLGCHIITIPPDLLKKIDLEDKDLEELSLETVNMFYKDACESGYKI